VTHERPIQIRGISYRKVGKKMVAIEYAYMAERATIFDQELVAWAERRAAALKPRAA